MIIHCDQFQTVDEVVFAEPGDMSLLGARALEGFNAAVHPKQKKLVAAGPILRCVTRSGSDELNAIRMGYGEGRPQIAGSTKSSFEEAMTVFDSAKPVIFKDDLHSEMELRFTAIGFSDKARLLTVSFVRRDDASRIISARISSKP